jgi:hypothetical protein
MNVTKCRYHYGSVPPYCTLLSKEYSRKESITCNGFAENCECRNSEEARGDARRVWYQLRTQLVNDGIQARIRGIEDAFPKVCKL